ncbi:MAG: DUF2213 domain-containing protein [Cetobacterium sp.]
MKVQSLVKNGDAVVGLDSKKKILKGVKKIEQRFNSLEIEVTATETTNGYFEFNGTFSVANTPMEYFYVDDHDGTITKTIEYIPEAELNKQEVLEEAGKVVVTNDHPWRLLDTSNTSWNIVGYGIGGVEFKDNKLSGNIRIIDRTTLAEIILNKKLSLSIGYECSMHKSSIPGVDYEQRDIRLNHLAIVDAGRAGEEAKLNSQMKFNSKQILEKLNKKEEMMAIKFNGKDLTETEVVTLLHEKENSIKTLEGEKEALQTKVNELETTKSTLEGEKAGLEAKINELPKQLEAKANAIADYERISGEKYNGTDIEKDLLGLKASILKENGIDSDGKDGAFIDGAFAVFNSKSVINTTATKENGLTNWYFNRGKGGN